MMKSLLGCYVLAVVCGAAAPSGGEAIGTFRPDVDLLSLHYDHAPDKDDGHSAAADRTLLESLYGKEWLANHVVAVSGAYGKNRETFNTDSDAVMDMTWNECGGWIAAHRDWDGAVKAVYDRWLAVLTAGGHVYVKEGGQSDLTAAVVERLRRQHPEVATRERIHVVQHGQWNEDQTTPEALEYVKSNTHYIRIRDANRYLNMKGGDRAFEKAAVEHPTVGRAWKAAFDYYPPKQRLDFSDTGELMHILGLGEIGIEEFKMRFLEGNAKGTSTTPQTGGS